MHTADEIKDWFLAWTHGNESARITKTKMQKLLYYAQGHSCAILGEPIFNDDIKASEFGPVVLEQLETLAEERESLALRNDFDFAWFADKHNQILADIWQTYGAFTSKELSEMFHLERPWVIACNKGYNTLIPLEDIEQFFLEQRYCQFIDSPEALQLVLGRITNASNNQN